MGESIAYSVSTYGIQPRRKFYTRNQDLCQTCLGLVGKAKTFFGVGSRNIRGSNPEESFIGKVRTHIRHVLAC